MVDPAVSRSHPTNPKKFLPLADQRRAPMPDLVVAETGATIDSQQPQLRPLCEGSNESPSRRAQRIIQANEALLQGAALARPRGRTHARS